MLHKLPKYPARQGIKFATKILVSHKKRKENKGGTQNRREAVRKRREQSKGRSQEREGAAGVHTSPSLSLLLEKSALNVITTLHALPLALMLPLLRTTALRFRQILSGQADGVSEKLGESNKQ